MAAREILPLTGHDEADRLLATDPLALLIGMVLDQQVPLEWAFRGPLTLKERLGGSLDCTAIATMDAETLGAAFKGPPALHRFPGSMAERVQKMCQHLVETYGGQADLVWSNAKTGSELRKNIEALPGFGKQKAQIFTALLAKMFDVKPPGWQDAAGPYWEKGFQSVADIDGPEALAKVREYKRQKKVAASN